MTDGTDMDDVQTATASQRNSDGHALPEFMGRAGFERELLDNSSNLICFCRSGTIEYVNTQGMRLLRAKNTDNLIGCPIIDLFDYEASFLLAKGLDKFAGNDEGTLLKLQSFDGTWIDVNMRVFQLNCGAAQADPVYMIECNDVSRYVKASEQTLRREARMIRVLQTITEGIIITDETGTIEDINPAAVKMFGIPEQTAVGRNIKGLMKADERDNGDDAVAQYFTTGEAVVLGELCEAEAARADGTTFPVEITVSEIDEGDGRRKLIGVMRDVTVRKQQLKQIEFLAHHDALTGLPNRHLFDDRLNQALIVTDRRKSSLALMFIDLDKFKSINDKFGHEVGDIVLNSVAARLLNRVRASDTVARVGGDEFVVILDDVGENENAAQIAKQMIDTLTAPIEVGGEKCKVGASIGIAMYPEDADTASSLLACADEAMYRVKTSGRNGYEFSKRLRE